jgi:NAD(P)-dependent dehydrogenase (short-subunit alcohol dehydrogenase family)
MHVEIRATAEIHRCEDQPRVKRARTPIDGRSVLVTGAASGIGRATALALAVRRARLVLTDVDAGGLERVAEEAGDAVLHAGPADVTNHAAVAALAAEVHAEHGSLDVVMNIAGIAVFGAVERLSHEQWRRAIDVNLMGPIHVIEAFVPPMIEAGRGGHLVNVSSAAGLLALPWHAAYSAGKFGLRGVSEVLRFDLRRHRIGVTLVCPGAVATPMVGSAEIAGVDREHPDARKLIERFGRHAVTPEHVADAIIGGVERRRGLVFTSRDIQAGYLVQRVCPPLYDRAMRLINDRMVAAAERAAR